MKRAGLLALLFAAGCASAPPPPQAPPPPGARPTPTPAPTPTPLPIPPPVTIPRVAGGVRVLLSTPGHGISLPQPGRPYRVEWKDGTRQLHGPLRLDVDTVTAWQVGAWQRPEHAARAAARLAAVLGGPGRVWRETAPSGLMRVRVVLPPGSPAARTRLAAAGFPGAVPVSLSRIRVTGSEGTVEAEAPVHLVPEGDWPTALGGRRYRGAFWLTLSGAGLRVINQLPLESYLRGVVPAEMGPHSFPELEALKAQAVAARTYAVAHLGDHEDEGYDLCDTPACQVYRGAGAEHPLTDRAVAETAGIIATFHGEPIDAMYTSTCGGHTEDAAELFPDRAQPYLKGVPCAWDRPLELEGTGEDGPWEDETSFRAAVAAAVLGTRDAAQALARLAALCSGTTPTGPVPAGPEGWADAVIAAAGLGEATRLEDGACPLEGLLRLADRHHVPLARPRGAETGAWRLAALAAALELQGLLVRDHGEAVPRPEGPGIYPRRADASEPLPLPAPLWERWGTSYRPLARATLLPGTRLERLRTGDALVALVVVRSRGDGEADRRSHWRWWSRERSWAWLERHLGVAGLQRLEVTRRTATGRVVGLRAAGAGGAVKEWSGFEVRRVLELPETVFTFHVLHRDGGRVVRFLGRGWGHGVGLCQNGAYGLARAGMTYDRILEHYYTGIELTTLPSHRRQPHHHRRTAVRGLERRLRNTLNTAGNAENTPCPSEVSSVSNSSETNSLQMARPAVPSA